MSDADATAAAAAQAAQSLLDAARSHKRLAQQHRREAQRLMQRFDDVLDQCKRAGINFHDTTQP